MAKKKSFLDYAASKKDGNKQAAKQAVEKIRLPEPEGGKSFGRPEKKSMANGMLIEPDRSRRNTMISRRLYKEVSDVAFDNGISFPDQLEIILKEWLND